MSEPWQAEKNDRGLCAIDDCTNSSEDGIVIKGEFDDPVTGPIPWEGKICKEHARIVIERVIVEKKFGAN